MNDDHGLERDVASVLAGLAPSHGPGDLLDDVFLTTGRMRPRPRWLALIKEPPMRTSSRVTVGSLTFRIISIAALTLILLIASVVAIGVGARVLATDTMPAPFGPAKTGPLLLWGSGDIYLADPDGSRPRDIIAGDSLDQVPWFSLEGTRIAFGRGSEVAMALMVADADGSNVTKLVPAGAWNAEFLPGGDRMVVTRKVGDRDVTSIIDATTGATILDLDPGMGTDWQFLPRPPDGHELLFRGYPDEGEPHAGLFTIGVDGTGLRQIGEISTDESDDQATFVNPVYSPDGASIAYWDWELGPNGSKPRGYLHMRDAESGAELPLPFDASGYGPQFSPDGRMILFENEVDSDVDNPLNQLFIVPTDGSGPRQPIGPTYHSGDDGLGFGFSPDGSLVLLRQTAATTIIDLATGEQTRLDSAFPAAFGWQRVPG